MTNLSTWHKDLSPVLSLVLAVLVLMLFFVYGYFLFSRLLAGNYLEKGRSTLEQARSTPIELLVERTVLYQNGLRFFYRALKLNPLDSRVNFELALAFKDIAEDEELNKSIDISELGLEERGRLPFYGLVKSNYSLAIAKEPANMLYHQGLGNAYENLEDFAAAEDQFEKAIYLDPQNASINLYLCKYFYAKDNKGSFERYLNKVVLLYKEELFGGGPNTRLNEMVLDFLRSINRQELIGK